VALGHEAPHHAAWIEGHTADCLVCNHRRSRHECDIWNPRPSLDGGAARKGVDFHDDIKWTDSTEHNQATLDFDHVSVLQIMLFSAITTTPNYLWQSWMEDRWPSTGTRQEKGERKIPRVSISNVVVKFVLDQTLGSLMNTMLYFVIMGLIKGSN